MNKIGFIFLALFYVVVSILSFGEDIDYNSQLIVCGALIALVGVPHGAIDNVLFLKKSDVTPLKFYAGYLISMILYLFMWIMFPVISLILFLFVSAYHFGESQFSRYFSKSSLVRNSLFLIWGINLISGMIYFNNAEVVDIFNSYNDLESFLVVFDQNIHLGLLISSFFFLVATTIYSLLSNKINIEDVLKEIFILAIIHLAFIVLPLMAGFTLYFVVLHSIKVLMDEFDFLKSGSKTYTVLSFLRQLLPFTLLSFVGGALIISLIYLGLINVSYILVSIILLSLITLPHSVVMYRFYGR